jgi:hypothetical protein
MSVMVVAVLAVVSALAELHAELRRIKARA